MDSRRLRAFVTVVDVGGISAAAQRLGYAQSSLSAQLRGLESELGVAVLVRSSTGVRLTEAGERLLPIAREALELEEKMRRAAAGGGPPLRIGALETLADGWLPDLLTALDHGAAGPVAATVSLTVGGRDRLGADLLAGRLDVVFLFDNGAPSSGPHATVGSDQVLLVAAPEHPLARTGAVTPETLLGTPFLVAEPGCTTQMLVDRFGRDLTGQTPVAMVTGSLSALLRLAAHGRGVALLPALAAEKPLAAGDLVVVPVKDGLPTVSIEARWRDQLGEAGDAVDALLRLALRNPPATTRETVGQAA